MEMNMKIINILAVEEGVEPSSTRFKAEGFTS